MYVYFGSRTGLGARPGRVLSGPTSGVYSLEWGVTSTSLDAGDLNGDGYSDVVVRALRTDALTTSGPVAHALVYHGGPSGPSARPTQVLPSVTTPGTEHGFALAAAGDLNGDGYGDLSVGDISVPEQYDDNAGFVHVYYGGADGVPSVPDVTLAMPSREHLFGWALAGGGNFNADAFADLFVTEPTRSGGAGYFRVFPGRSSGVAWDAVTVTPNPDTRGSSKIGTMAAQAGDVNGDGYSDVVVGQRGFSVTRDGRPVYIPGTRLLVYFGGPSGLSSTFGQDLGSTEEDAVFLLVPAGSGDVNGDGYSDLAAPTANAEIKLFLGGASGYAPAAAATLPALITPSSSSGIYSSHVSASVAHDFDRDGYSDLYTSGRVYRGGAAGLSTVPALVLTGP